MTTDAPTYRVPPEKFLPGLELSEGFFHDLAAPLVQSRFPRLRYAAALMGHCSDALGLDTHISTDHVWGPRVQLFLSEADFARFAAELDQMFREQLPVSYRGLPTNYSSSAELGRCARLEPIEKPPVNHFVEIETVRRFVNRDITWTMEAPPSVEEWLGFREQGLLELTCGKVFHDAGGELTKAREHLAFYPRPVWLFKMYCLWAAVNEEQAFAGRCHDLGDELGERVIVTRIVNKLMKLCFHLERKYFPYSKWLGTAFAKLDCARELLPVLNLAIRAASYDERSRGLCAAYQQVGALHNRAEVTDKVDALLVDYYERGYRGVQTEGFKAALRQAFEPDLQAYDLDLLSRTVLYDDSGFGNYRRESAGLVAFAKKS